MQEHSGSRRTLLKLGIASSLTLIMPDVASARQPIERPIPSTGEMLPVVGLGTWQAFDVAGDAAELAQARDTLSALVSMGGRVIDSSPMYRTAESVIGQLSSELKLRDRLFVATKVWTEGRAAGLRQMEDSLKKLRLDRLDLMQVHNLVDTATHLATLRDWKESGRVRYAGVTHYRAGAHADLEKVITAGMVDFLQVNYSLAEPEAGQRLLRAAADHRVAVIVNRPFAEGAMFGAVKNKPLPGWARDIGCASWAQFFLKWIIAHPAVTCVIPGTRSPKHVVDNLAAAQPPLPDPAMRERMSGYFRSL